MELAATEFAPSYRRATVMQASLLAAVGLGASLFVLMTSCIKWPNSDVSSTQHDKLIFETAMSAVEQERFTVANLTLQTLINTYPDSEYSSKAKEVLEDPRIAPCDEAWTSSPHCIDRRVETTPETSHVLNERGGLFKNI
jgi:hypothetical protein